jgi:hypothetical protein
MNALANLKKQAVLFVAALTIGLSTTAAHAQYETQRVQFTAPFAFDYGSQQLPAGRYTVTRENAHILIVRNGAKSVMVMTQTSDDRETTTRGKVVFHRVGQRYFLSQVWIPGKSSHLTCGPTKTEKKLMVGQNNVAPSDVELALLEMPR